MRDVRDVDLALIFGIGFPPFRGGLFFWADQIGAAKIVEKLKQYAAARQTLRSRRAMLKQTRRKRAQVLRLSMNHGGTENTRMKRMHAI